LTGKQEKHDAPVSSLPRIGSVRKGKLCITRYAARPPGICPILDQVYPAPDKGFYPAAFPSPAIKWGIVSTTGPFKIF